MKISIITVTLNCREAAVETAKSVLEQTSGDYEYIVKDGGSTDGTVEALSNLGLKVTVIPDTGIYDAMNQAVDLASGDYLYFLNAGDSFFGSDVVGRVSENIDENASIYYCDLCLLPMNTVTNYPNIITKYYLFRKNINHQACFVSRDLYLALGKFKVTYKFNADQYFLRDALINHYETSKKINIIVSRWTYGGFSTRKPNRNVQSKERWNMIKVFYSWHERWMYGIRSLYFMNFAKNFIWDLKYGKMFDS